MLSRQGFVEEASTLHDYLLLKQSLNTLMSKLKTK